jgi:hypothetical protein
MVANSGTAGKLIHDSARHANCAVFGALTKFCAFNGVAFIAKRECGDKF